MQSWQIMSASSWATFGIVKAETPEQALIEAVKHHMIIADTWTSFEIKDGFRIYIK